MAGLIRLALVILLALVVISNGWSGNYGSRLYCLSRLEGVCAYQTYQACCYWKTISRAYEETRYFCLPGWRHNGNKNCNIAICNPSCKNSGTCSLPNQCACTGAFNGPTCEGKLCSHLKPCYPGECSSSSFGGSQCSCETNFQYENNGCLNMRQELTPEIYQCQIVLRYYTSKKGVFMNKYSILLDTTVNGNQILNDELWSNRDRYNKIDFMGISNFDPNVNSPVPSSYISEAKFGLVDVKFETVLEKENGDRLVNENGELSCSNPPSKNSPILGVHNCTVLDTNYDYRINNGDNLTITVTIQSGGYRKLKNIDTGVDYQTQYYTGQTMEKRVMFRFDSEKPYHCFPNCIDDSKILEFGDEYTKNPLLQLRWDGWEDSLSGVYRYAWEIFRLTPNVDGELREKDPLDPIKIAEVNNTDFFEYPNYTLPEPGLYSIILQVADKANNSEYVRRFVLYDPNPRIQISDDPEKRLHSSSSTKESNYTWQADTTGGIKFDWTGFFYNEFLEENQLLNQILDYPLQFYSEGPSEHKYVARIYKNEDGRNQAEVPNARGMTSVQYGYHKDNNGGNSQPLQPTTWFYLSNLIETKFDLKLQVDSGETVVFWVKATDPFGNERIEKTQTSFDSSRPIVTSVLFDYESGSVSGRSRLTCVAKDMESGIALVSWKAVREDTNIEYANGTIPWPQSNYQANADIRELVCLAKIDRCFDIEAKLEIDNCDLRLPSSEDSTGVTLNVDVLNQAMISGPRQSLRIDDIKKLPGYKQCYPACDNGMNGAGCIKLCSDRKCKDKCDIKTGECIDGCLPGYQSMDCTRECDEGTYGQHCQFNCSARFCKTHRECNHIDGACCCLDGYQGIDCSIKQVPVSSGSNDQRWIIIGTILGLIIGLIAGVLLVLFIMKRRLKSNANQSHKVTQKQTSNNVPQQETPIDQPVTQPSSNTNNNQHNPYAQLTTIYQNENAYELLGKS